MNKGRTKENLHLKLKKDSFNRERTERKKRNRSREEAVRKATNMEK